MEAFLTYLKSTSQRELAERLGCHPSAISQWIMNGKIPAERLFQLELITGISPRALRPDLFIEPKTTDAARIAAP
jgi:DNA-binding transcriptional regulator YdaS (Cro superfamily)